MSNLSLLSAVAGVGMADPFSDSGIPSRRIYTLTERTAAAWSKFLDRAAVGGDPYTLTERSGALEAARAFLDSIPLDRLSRARKATVAKLIRHLESPMHRKHNPTSSTLQVIRQYLPNAARRGAAYAGSVGEGAAKRSIWVEPAGRSATVKVYRYADPRIDNTLSAHVLESEYSGDLATVVLRAVQVAEATIAEQGNGARTGNPGAGLRLIYSPANAAWCFYFGDSMTPIKLANAAEMFYRDRKHAVAEARIHGIKVNSDGTCVVDSPNPADSRTDNPPALIWEFDGEPTSPKELLADNPDNGDVAAAVAYLKAEGAKFSMGRHGTKGVRSWSAVSFGGGAADESVLTVRAAWTEGPVFKAVLDASTIPYAGDLPDAD